MKRFLPAAVVLILGFSLLGASELRVSGKLRKGFEALEIYNYFAAKDYFYKALKKDSVPASYGLSVIYGRDDNPFFAPDSALKFIRIAVERYPGLDEKDREDYLEVGVDSAAIARQLYRVDSLFYHRAETLDSLEVWNNFLENHHTEPFRSDAERNRNRLAFEQAKSENSARAYRDFMDTYPDAFEYNKAEEAYEARLFMEETAGDDVQEYRNFIQDYPESPFRESAEDRIYEKYTKKQTPAAFLKFIRENPDNRNVESAWRKIYSLEIQELTPNALAAFSIKYPQYPFLDELKSDFNYATTRYYPVEKNGKWGFIDEDGNLKIAPKYDFVEEFKESIALVGIGDEVAYIDKSGRQITDFKFESGFSFINGFAVVENEGLYGVINRQGAEIIDVVYEDIGEFSEGLIYADKGNGYGYFNTEGVLVINYVFDNASDFKNGLAVVEVGGKYGLVNQSGKAVTEFKYDWIEPFPADGNPARTRIGDRFGLMKPAGEAICDSLYYRIASFSEGLALAYNDENYGFVNAECDTAVEFKYSFTEDAFRDSRFEGGYAKVWQKDRRRETKLGVIDTAGNKVFPAIFEDVGDFRGNRTAVKKNGMWGYADSIVDLVIPYNYLSAGNFKNHLAVVQTDKGYNLIDTMGNATLNKWYKTFKRIDSLAVVSDTLYGLIGVSGSFKVPMFYNSYQIIDDHVIRFNCEDDGFEYFDYRRLKFIWRETT
ncbi:MAG: WG repeat-containing protein [Cryomorphaceae bacterium]